MMSEPQVNRGRAILRLSVDAELDYEKIKVSLKKLRGITDVSINQVTNVVKVEYDPNKLTLEKIREELERAQRTGKR